MKDRLSYKISDPGGLTKLGKAFSSETRVNILNILMQSPMNLSEIASHLKLPISSVAMHVNILDEAGLIQVNCIPGLRGSQKLCSIKVDSIHIDVYSPLEKNAEQLHQYTYAMPIGNYYSLDVKPSCGIVSEKDFIGSVDTIYSFYDPIRTQAQLLWFFSGWIEYRFPSVMFRTNKVDSLRLSMELCSEAPGYQLRWPSDLTIELNGIACGTITLPGDYGGRRGNLNPDWWSDRHTQYGDLYHIRVDSSGTYSGEHKLSDVSLSDLDLLRQDYLSLRLDIRKDAKNVGGVNLFGEKFGDYEQNIMLNILYHPT